MTTSTKSTATTASVTATDSTPEKKTPMKTTTKKKTATKTRTPATTSPATSTVAAPVSPSTPSNGTVPAPGLIEPVPSEVAPSPPANFVFTKIGRSPGPLRAQVDLALKVAAELRSESDYTQLFGDAAPNAASIAEALTLAKGWSDKRQNADAWYNYVRTQETLAWKQAFTLMKPLQVPFEFRLSRDAALGEELPSTTAFFGAVHERAQRGVETRKKNKAQKATAAGSAPATSATPAVASDPLKTAALRLLN